MKESQEIKAAVFKARVAVALDLVVDKITDKAVCFRVKGKECKIWFPKKALAYKEGNNYFEIKPWFKFDSHQNNVWNSNAYFLG